MRAVITYGFDDATPQDAQRTRDYLHDEVFLVEATPPEGETLKGVLETVSVGQVTLARHTTRTASIRRRRSNGYGAGPIGGDTFQLAFHTRCAASRLTQRGRSVENAACDGTLVYGGDPFEGDFKIGDGTNQIVAAILPPDLAQALQPRALDRTMRRIDRRQPGLALLRSYIAGIMDGPPLGSLTPMAESHLCDLWRATLEDPALIAPEPSPGVEAARAAAALGIIARRYMDAALTRDAVARALGVSPRAVQRALAARGRTFRDALGARRLERAAELLRAPSWAGVKIVEIAYASGFSDMSHFNRAFRSRFGKPPGAWRAD